MFFPQGRSSVKICYFMSLWILGEFSTTECCSWGVYDPAYQERRAVGKGMALETGNIGVFLCCSPPYSLETGSHWIWSWPFFSQAWVTLLSTTVPRQDLQVLVDTLDSLTWVREIWIQIFMPVQVFMSTEPSLQLCKGLLMLTNAN